MLSLTHSSAHTLSLSQTLTCPVVCVSWDKQDIMLTILWGHQLREIIIDVKNETLPLLDSCSLSQNAWLKDFHRQYLY